MKGLFGGGGLGGVDDEVARVLGKSRESASRRSFNRDFNPSDFDSFGGDTQPGKYIEIASFTVPASTEYAYGYGSAENPENQGYLYVDLQTSTPSAVDGTIRLAMESPTGRNTEVVADYDTTRLDASKSDKAQMVPLPEQVSAPLVTQDSSLVLYFNDAGGASSTISQADSDMILPMTEYDLSG